ncbi:MAG: metallophosphoesterase, partial [Ruminococcus sp.]|nr:metallophosphoesterase [Ruminococcus sp.]
MIYVMSDIHGCYDKYRDMLERLNLTDKDALFVLGDVIDYGDDGIKILKDMMYRTNIYPILGEHEYMAKKLLAQFEKATSVEDCANYIQSEDVSMLEKWLKNGGNPTLEAFLALSEEDRESVLDYLNTEFAPYEEVEAGGRKFVLVHAGIRNFDESKALDEYDEEDFVLESADYDRTYFIDKFLVTGHTPTLSILPNGNGKVYSKKRHLAIDCAAFFGGRLAAVCLDTLKGYY